MATSVLVPSNYQGSTIIIHGTTYPVVKTGYDFNSATSNTLRVAPGDTIIVSSAFSGRANFVSTVDANEQPVTIQLQSTTNTVNLNFLDTGFTLGGDGSLSPTIIVADGIKAPNVNILGSDADNMVVKVGTNASLGNITGGDNSNDTITTGAGSTVGNITTSGGADAVTIGGTAGTITTGAGDDNVTLTSGAKTGAIDTGADNDAVSIGDGVTVGGALTTGAGDDKITVGSGSSLQNVDVGDGSDNLTLGNNNTLGGIDLGAGGANGDLVTAGTGNTVTGNITQAVSDAYSKVTFGDQTRLNGNVELNGGRDTLTLGDSSTVTGSITTGSDLSGDDADVLNIGAGSSIGGYINTNTGNDTVTIGDNTTLSGGWNAINTELGDDVINLGAGVVATNPIFTGAGSDTVNASTGNFVVEQGGVVPNDDVTVITAAPGAYKDLIAALNKQGFVDPDGDGRYYKDPNQTFTYGGVTYRQIDYIEAVPCFARGTLIRTPRGDVAIEDLAVGDLVDTCDRGAQAIRWIGSRFLDGNALAEMPHLRPIRIRRGALGSGLPTADLLVSPQHRVLVRSRIAQKMFGTDEVLVAAKQLCQIDGIDIDQDVAHVEYFHMLFDAHEVVVSNGAETESLFTGEEALKSVGPAARDEIFALFPELADPDHVSIAARTLASGRMGRKLAVRHANNGKPLVM